MIMQKSCGILAALALVVTVGCGGGGGSDSPSQQSGSHSGSSTTTAGGGGSTGSAKITGSVQFAGTAPTPAKIKMDADPRCKIVDAADGLANDVVVNTNSTLKWVFVYVKSGLEGKSYNPPSEPVVLNQEGCRYEPHMFGIMANQPLKILNSDDTLHNIHSLAKNSKQFNLAMPRKGMELTKKFSDAEVMVRIKCDVHPWMETWAGVMSHPFFAVTGDDGAFSLDGLPAGTYTVEAWHEEHGAQTQQVTVQDGEAKNVSFSFGA